MQTVSDLLEHISSDNLPYTRSSFIDELERIRARHIRKMREAIPAQDLPPLGQTTPESLVVAYDGVIQMAEELFVRILQGIRSPNAGIYEKLATQTVARARTFAVQVWSTLVSENVPHREYSCFSQELDATLHALLQKAITAAWVEHEAFYSDAVAREKERLEALLGPTLAPVSADIGSDTTGHLGPADEMSGRGTAEMSVSDTEPCFQTRAAWLKDRLLERGWSNSDASQYGGPDRKTIQKMLRGEAVRNDILQKLADALSMKGGKVNVLDIPRN